MKLSAPQLLTLFRSLADEMDEPLRTGARLMIVVVEDIDPSLVERAERVADLTRATWPELMAEVVRRGQGAKA